MKPADVRQALASLAIFAGLLAGTGLRDHAIAAESATSFYLLGSGGSNAGVVPPPGTYLVDFNYYYSGSGQGMVSESLTLRRTGVRDFGGIALTLDATLKADAQAFYQIPTAVWVAPQQFLGGNLGFSMAMPMGWKDINVGVNALATFTFSGPLSTTLSRGQSFALDDQRKDFGDPIAGAFIGWHQGNLHWKLGTMVNIPVGAWDPNRLANIGFNHWAFDLSGGLTWLDPAVGLELSVAPGLTWNTENPDSHYKSGTDFHVEFAAMQNLSKQIAVGVTGYHYQQLTGDSGSGAVLGDFKGRVTAVGPQLNYNFQIGPLPVFTSLKWTHEFNVENRLKGDMGLLTLTVPLGPPTAPPASLPAR